MRHYMVTYAVKINENHSEFGTMVFQTVTSDCARIARELVMAHVRSHIKGNVDLEIYGVALIQKDPSTRATGTKLN